MKVAMLIISTMLGILVLSFKEVIPSGERAIGFDRIAPELRIRKGLPDFFKKASRGDSVRVAYLGGSITAQNGWRKYSLEWLREVFPTAHFSEIYAAIGGTGSDFAAFRLQEQVLFHRPDLVFVEFAVNDDKKPEEKIIRSMESIVRNIRNNNPKTDICFVYTIKQDFVELEMKGDLPASAKAMEKVADHYGIPSVNFGYEVCRLLSKDELVFKGGKEELAGVRVFSPDGVHPYTETGHRIYFASFQRSFEKIRARKLSGVSKIDLPAPLEPAFYASPQMLDFTEGTLKGKWDVFDPKDDPLFSQFRNAFTQIGRGEPGATLSVRFKGTAIGICDIMGPEAGAISIEIDGQPHGTQLRFDAYCTYRRMNYLLIDELPDRPHKIIFKVMSDPINKAEILAQRGNVMKDVDAYQAINWYPGKLLVNGTLTP